MAGRKGAIAFGLVYIPVELFTATQDDAVRFNQLAKDSMKRVRYVKTCPDCKRELKPEDMAITPSDRMSTVCPPTAMQRLCPRSTCKRS